MVLIRIETNRRNPNLNPNRQAFAHAKNNPKIEVDDSHKEYAYKFEVGMDKVSKT